MVSIIDILLGSSSSSRNDEDDKQNYLTERIRLVFGVNEYNNHYRVEKYTLVTVSIYLLSISELLLHPILHYHHPSLLLLLLQYRR